MARLHRSREGSIQVREIEVDGSDVVIRTKDGDEWLQERFPLSHPTLAMQHVMERVREHLADGWHEVDSSAPPPPNSPVETRIIADPNDLVAWGVHADWLASQGDPRAQLIAIHRRMLDTEGREWHELQERAARLIRDQRFLGDVPKRWGPAVHIGWRLGYVAHAHFQEGKRDLDAPAFLRTLYGLESARFLQGLALVANNVPQVLAELAAQSRPSLRALRLVGPRLGLLTTALRATPSLRWLGLQGTFETLGLVWPRGLEQLAIRTSSPGMLEVVVRAPSLRSLTLGINWGAVLQRHTAPLDVLDELLPELETLGLQTVDANGDLVHQLLQSQLLLRLKHLRLPGPIPTGRLIQAADQMAHLESVVLDDPALSDEAREALRMSIPGVKFAPKSAAAAV